VNGEVHGGRPRPTGAVVPRKKKLYLMKRTYYQLLIMQYHHTSVASSLLNLNILLSTKSSNIINLCSYLRWEIKFHTNIKEQVNLQSCVFSPLLFKIKHGKRKIPK
jgi:hypothetical protein